MFDLLCIKKSEIGDDDDILNSLEDATGESIDFGSFADFDDIPAYSAESAEGEADLTPEVTEATPEPAVADNQDSDPIPIP